MNEIRHIVFIYPHPDDESFGSAGTILKMRKKGIRVTYLCGTRGEMGRNMGVPPFANRESMAKIREQELKDACQFLDCDLEILGYRDKMMEFEDEEKVANHLLQCLERLNPTHVVTYHPLYGVHPDHNAIARATIRALEKIKVEKRPELWVRPIVHNYRDILGEPDINYDITNIFDQKMKAIAKHKSQADGILGDMLRKARKSSEVMQEALDILGQEDYYYWDYSEKY